MLGQYAPVVKLFESDMDVTHHVGGRLHNTRAAARVEGVFNWMRQCQRTRSQRGASGGCALRGHEPRAFQIGQFGQLLEQVLFFPGALAA